MDFFGKRLSYKFVTLTKRWNLTNLKGLNIDPRSEPRSELKHNSRLEQFRKSEVAHSIHNGAGHFLIFSPQNEPATPCFKHR